MTTEILSSDGNRRQWLESVLSAVVEALLIVDSDGRVICLNDAAMNLLGTSYDKIRDKKASDVVSDLNFTNFVNDVLKCGKKKAQATEIAVDNKRRVSVEATTVLKDGKGRAVGAVFVLRDVTELKRMEHIRQNAMANVSHELKTPITAIIGFLETLENGAIDDPTDARHFIGIISRHANRLRRIVDGLLTLSKLERDLGSGEIAVSREHIRPVLEAAVSSCEDAAMRKQIAIELQCDESLESNINPLLLEQAVANLVDNAIKYSESPKPVLVRCTKEAFETIISVEDSGVGISEEHRTKIFDQFYCVDKMKSREIGGTGLGLAIVKRIALMHNGRVDVDSIEGKGCKFTISIPPKLEKDAGAFNKLTVISQRYYRNLIRSIYLFDSNED